MGIAGLHTSAGRRSYAALVQHVCSSARADGPGRQSPMNSEGDDSGEAPPATVHGGDDKLKKWEIFFLFYLFVYYFILPNGPGQPNYFSALFLYAISL